MESKRQKQVAELVKRNFSLVLQQEGGYLYGHQVMVTVTNVHMSPDLALAKIYLSVFNTENKQEPLLMLETELLRLRQSLGQRIRKLVRIIPEIVLYLDDTIDEMYRVDALMNRLHEDGQMGKE
jgi:ribosome-binding factor A